MNKKICVILVLFFVCILPAYAQTFPYYHDHALLKTGNETFDATPNTTIENMGNWSVYNNKLNCTIDDRTLTCLRGAANQYGIGYTHLLFSPNSTDWTPLEADMLFGDGLSCSATRPFLGFWTDGTNSTAAGNVGNRKWLVSNSGNRLTWTNRITGSANGDILDDTGSNNIANGLTSYHVKIMFLANGSDIIQINGRNNTMQLATGYASSTFLTFGYTGTSGFTNCPIKIRNFLIVSSAKGRWVFNSS